MTHIKQKNYPPEADDFFYSEKPKPTVSGFEGIKKRDCDIVAIRFFYLQEWFYSGSTQLILDGFKE